MLHDLSFSIDMFLCTSNQVDVLTGMDRMGSWNNAILRAKLILQASRVWYFSHIGGLLVNLLLLESTIHIAFWIREDVKIPMR